jgi:ATP-dependent RNA helicase DeaD
VFHFSLPDDLAYYTHRSGRTARAGKTGSSIAFIHHRDKHVIDRLEKQLGIRFEQIMIPSAQDIAAQRMEGWCMQVLQTGAKGALSKDILDRAQVLFGGLSKEELLAKVLHYELRSLELHTTRDLNAVEQKKWKKVMGQKKPVSQLKPGKKKWDSNKPREGRKSFRQK